MAENEPLAPADVLKNSIEAIRKGDAHVGRQGLIWVIQRDRTNIQAWLWLAYIIEDKKAKVDCYQRVLRLDPANETARKGIAKYGETPSPATASLTPAVRAPGHKALSELEYIETGPATTSTVNSRLDQARRDLLDLSLFNRLLNYRSLKSKGLEIVDEKPVEVFRILVQEGRPMSFLPTRKQDRQTKQATLLAETSEPDEVTLGQPGDDEGQRPDRHTDNKLQTPYTSEVLQSRLLNTYSAARTYVEEQGVNVLFLVLGTLRWYEAPSSEEARTAPLLLLPVELTRTDARSKFHVRYTEEEIGENLSLRAKLASDFGIMLPAFPEDEELDVALYLHQVTDAIRVMPRWEVEPEAVALGFFSFGKFLMFHDLKPDLWPEDMQPADHAILKGLLGNRFRREDDLLADDADTDEHLSPEDTHHVLDADSSQTIVILEAGRGRNLVVQGPPGTGKSQTIANLVAEALASGKTVLFVAEKMAALEVVKRRLDRVGLGEACLELHSHKANKKTLLNELKRALELGQPKMGTPIDLADLKRNRDRLNGYSRAVNEEIGDSHLTPYEVYGRLLLLKDALAATAPPEVATPGIEAWPLNRIELALSTTEELQVHIMGIGRPVDHPFWGCEITILLPSDQERIVSCLRAAIAALRALGEEAAKTPAAVLLPSRSAQDDIRKTGTILKYLLSAPPLAGVDIRAEAWITDAVSLQQVTESGIRLTELHRVYQATILPEAWKVDVSALRAALQPFVSKWWRAFSPRYRAESRRVKALCQSSGPKSIGGQLALLDAILEAQTLTPILEAFERSGSELFGQGWEGQSSDWIWIRETAAWMRSLHEAIQREALPPTTLTFLGSSPDLTSLRDLATRLEHLLEESNRTLGEVVATLHLNEAICLGEGRRLASCPFAEQAHLLRQWSGETHRLHEMVTLSELMTRMHEVGLQGLIAPLSEWPEAAHHAVHLLEHTWLSALLQRTLSERPVLARFDGDMHGHYMRKFCDRDLAMLHQNRVQLAHQHWKTLPRHEAEGRLGILYHEFAKKRRHKPIRTLMAEAGKVIQVLKPVFMMSPLSVAMYLPRGSVDFDLVIFDEASQVKPVDAFGAILRGHQVVVVGDDRQLPPTTFFETSVDVDDDYSESVTVDLESILGLCVAQGMPQRMLRWHYRSQHESLITVSNYEFYDNKLTVFPSPDNERRTVGLVYHYLPDTEYGRGGSRKNIAEARAVAETVMEHAHNSPDLTLGVAAFSASQMEAVRDQLEVLRRADPSCERFFQSHPEEPFFIKNLENVQGDERDVIFISIGYGRTAEGKVSMSFGPLNSDGGERRLNVLITRAKKRCEVFTNLRADDIDLGRTNARGVQVLKRFLKYADTGSLDLPTPSDREPGSAFEEAVASRLRALGYRVDHQVGTGGFFIDLAVVDEVATGRYLLGLECDGATYHSARSARDRDRLRQEVLETLGWRIHRIWSTDWFRNPEREIARAQAAIAAAQGSRRAPLAEKQVLPDQPAAVEIPRSAPSRASNRAVRIDDYVMVDLTIRGHRDDLHEVPAHWMAEWIRQVVSVESPVHEGEVLRRIADAAGVHRVGNRIEAAFQVGLQAAADQGLVKRRGRFLWDSDSSRLHVRSRSSLPNLSRRLDLIAPEEIALATSNVTESSYGIGRENLAKQVCEVFGFARVTEGMTAVVDNVIAQMLADGRLVSQGPFLALPQRN